MSFENVDGGRTTNAWLYYELTYETCSSGELKTHWTAKMAI